MAALRTYGNRVNASTEDPTRCIVEVDSGDHRMSHFNQCRLNRGHGPDGLYCKGHNPGDGNTTTVWLLNRYGGKIEKFMCIRWNGAWAWVAKRDARRVLVARRESANNQYGQLFATFNEAKAALVARCQRALANAEAAIQVKRDELEAAMDMREPVEAKP